MKQTDVPESDEDTSISYDALLSIVCIRLLSGICRNANPASICSENDGNLNRYRFVRPAQDCGTRGRRRSRMARETFSMSTQERLALSYEQQCDEWLLERLLEKDWHAFEVLYSRHHRRIVNRVARGFEYSLAEESVENAWHWLVNRNWDGTLCSDVVEQVVSASERVDYGPTGMDRNLWGTDADSPFQPRDPFDCDFLRLWDLAVADEEPEEEDAAVVQCADEIDVEPENDEPDVHGEPRWGIVDGSPGVIWPLTVELPGAALPPQQTPPLEQGARIFFSTKDLSGDSTTPRDLGFFQCLSSDQERFTVELRMALPRRDQDWTAFVLWYSHDGVQKDGGLIDLSSALSLTRRIRAVPTIWALTQKAVNLCRDSIRQSSRMKPMCATDDGEERPIEFESREPTAELSLIASQQRLRVWSITMQSLKELVRERELGKTKSHRNGLFIALRYIAGMDNPVIARIMNEKYGNVGRVVSRKYKFLPKLADRMIRNGIGPDFLREAV